VISDKDYKYGTSQFTTETRTDIDQYGYLERELSSLIAYAADNNISFKAVLYKKFVICGHCGDFFHNSPIRHEARQTPHGECDVKIYQCPHCEHTEAVVN